MAKTPESKKAKPKKAPANTAASEESARKVVARQRGLGRGLSSLLGDAAVSVSSSDASAGTAEQPAAALPAAQLTGLVDMPIEWINSGPWQPRRRFDIAALEELADSIRSKGLVQPVLVRAQATKSDHSDKATDRRGNRRAAGAFHPVSNAHREVPPS